MLSLGMKSRATRQVNAVSSSLPSSSSIEPSGATMGSGQHVREDDRPRGWNVQADALLEGHVVPQHAATGADAPFIAQVERELAVARQVLPVLFVGQVDPPAIQIVFHVTDSSRQLGNFVPAVIGADDPVERPVVVGGQPYFLGERPDLAGKEEVHVQRGGAVGFLGLPPVVLLVAGHRQQADVAELLLDGDRPAPVVVFQRFVLVDEGRGVVGVVAGVGVAVGVAVAVEADAGVRVQAPFQEGLAQLADVALFPVADVLEVDRLRPVAAAEQLEVYAEVIGGFPHQLHAAREDVHLADIVAGGAVVDPAFALPHGHQADAPGKRIADRAAHRRLDFRAVPAAVADACIAVCLAARLAGEIADRAAVGVAPENVALGPLDHLHALDVEQVGAHDRHRGLEHFVDEQADARRVAGLEAVHADAADGVDGHGIAPHVLDVEVWRLVGHLGDVRPPEIVEIFLGERVHRDVHVLDALGALLGGDEDFLDGAVTLLGTHITDSRQ